MSEVSRVPYDSLLAQEERSQPQLYRTEIKLENLINACTLKIKSNPLHKKAMYIRARCFLKKNMFTETIEDCHQILNIDNKNVNAYYLIGCAHEKLGETETAISSFTIVVELDPTHFNAFYARGACLNKLGLFK